MPRNFREKKESSESKKSFTFIDLFAGIGGFHTALHGLGGECVYASEWDLSARKTYEANYKPICPKLFEKDLFRGDITLEENRKCIPEDADLLCGGFPCQPFSQAGLKKGFSETRGTLFFEIAGIIKNKRPKAFFLENVRHILTHDGGKTFAVICRVLKEELRYSVYFKVLKASDYGLPTRRPRVYIVGFREDIPSARQFAFPDPIPLQITMSDVFGAACSKRVGYTLRVGGGRSGINDRRNWDAYLVEGKVKIITPQEGKKMMGFPDHFHFPVSDIQALRQLGNSVAVKPIQMTAANILQVLSDVRK